MFNGNDDPNVGETHKHLRQWLPGRRYPAPQGNVTMDLNSVERIEFDALGGADNITINDLTGTDVKQVAIDLGWGRPTIDGRPEPAEHGRSI